MSHAPEKTTLFAGDIDLPEAKHLAQGLTVERVFSTEGEHPFDSVVWERRDAAIKNHKGEAIFEQKNVEFPVSWSLLATNVVASKYFYGDLAGSGAHPASGGREDSLKQLIHRVTRTLADWGIEQGYFATQEDGERFYDELTWLCTHQYGAFNSPVWFNVGLYPQYGVRDTGGKRIFGWDASKGAVAAVDPYERPQGSACFIISVDDSIDDIWQLMGESARLFKFGSGVGADWSKLRSSKEKLSGGGTPSGPVSFMRVQDATGGTIKSGGKCLAPYTKVYTERGPVTVEELAGLKGDWPFYVLSYDPPDGRMKVKRARAWRSGVKEVVRIHTDKGHFDLSFDHPVKLAGGPFELAGNLQPGQRLFQSTLDPQSAGYVRVSLRDGKKGRDLLHRMVAADVLEHDLDGLSVHHRDGNKLNNHPDNLEVISQAEHARLHGEALAEAGEHVFLHAHDDPRFDSSGEDNGMHCSGWFWQDRRRAKQYRQQKRAEMLERGPERLQQSAVRQRYMNLGWRLLNAGHDIATVDQFFAAYEREIGRVDSKPRRREAFEAQFGGYDGFLNELDASNHRVVRVEWLGDMDVYSVEVDCPTPDDKSPQSGHNYLIWSGDNETPFGSGVVVSNTRRAAIMQTLKVHHPDVLEFVEAKQKEERKAWALIEEGYDGSFNGPAYGSVAFQNVNQSVRLDDAFMAAAEEDKPYGLRAVLSGEVMEEISAKHLLHKIAEGTHVCGDPGVQYEDTIQKWHTVKNTGPINSSNPCVTGDTLVATEDGLRRIDALLGETPRVVGLDGRLHRTTRVVETGTKPVYRLRTRSGYEVKLTADHRVWTENRGDVPAAELTKDDFVRLAQSRFGKEALEADVAEYVGLMLGDGCIAGGVAQLTMSKQSEVLVAEKAAKVVSGFERRGGTDVHVTEHETRLAVTTAAASVREMLAEYAILDEKSASKRLTDRALQLTKEATAALLRGLFTAGGTVVDVGAKTQYVGLDSTSETMLQQVQTLLLGFGIKSTLYRNRRLTDRALLPDGQGGLKERDVQQTHSLRITRRSRVRFEREIGFMRESLKADALAELNADVRTYRDALVDSVASLTLLGEEPVYDLTEPATDHFAANGVVVHNCSEYMHVDDSACNLASLNLRKFQRPDGTFDVERFRAATRVFITAQEILVDNAGYPSEKIAANSHAFRPLGLGFANLGALLMAMGLPYDSDEGRAVAGAIMAIEHGEAYARSAEIAGNKQIGPFAGYAENAEPMQEVMRMHAASVEDVDKSCPGYLLDAARETWARCLALGERHGYRNAQATVLAPTGCLVGGSLVSTDRGLVRLSTLGDPLGDQWQDAAFKVHTDEGEREATKFYVNGVALTRKLRTRSGYAIQGTLKHRIKVVDPNTGMRTWKRFSDIREGDIVPLAMNTIIGEPREVTLPPLGEMHWNGDHATKVPRTVTPELAELIGYFMGDGSLHAKGLRFCVDEQDADVADRLRALARTLFNLEAYTEQRQGYLEVGIRSVPLTLWWEACGFAKLSPEEGHSGKGYRPYVPDAVLHANSADVYGAFLRGLFEADGTLIEGVPQLCTGHLHFAEEVKSLLLALGYPTTSKTDQSGWGDEVQNLRLKNRSYNAPFRRHIGFISQRKQEAVAEAVTRSSAKGDRIYLGRDLVEELVPAGSPHRNAVLLSMRRHGAVPRQRVEQLYDETRDERLVRYMGFFYDVVEANEDGGEQLTYDLSVPENVTYTANGFISHNTIGFMMDCDTTGIEPDIALVKYKLLAGKGDGMLKIVNRTVPEALTRLGYSEAERQAILDYVEEHDTIEGAPGLKEEHLPVFDCAFKPFGGTRSIHHVGHIRMMAACQPFISGAISKTCNVPEDATVEDIADAYLQAWKLGLKAVAIYRENSKRSQPLSTSKEGNTKKKAVAETSGDGIADVEAEVEVVEKVVEKVVYKPIRKRLPDERPSITHKFSVAGHEGYLHIGLYPDTQMPGEIFITMAKQGSTISGVMDAFATSISMAFQYGVPLEDLCAKFSHMRFEPAGFTNNKAIPIAKSVMDYIFRYLALKFLGQARPEAEAEDAVNPNAAAAEVVDRSGPAQDEEQMDMFGAEGRTSDALVGQTVEAFFKTQTPRGDEPVSKAEPMTPYQNQADAPSCPNCGSITVRAGACYSCVNCGSTSGCG